MKDFHFCSKCAKEVHPVDDVILTSTAMKAVSRCCFVTILVLKDKPDGLYLGTLKRLLLEH